jgi:hypothetical protein
MRKYILISLFLVTLQSCKQKITATDLPKLNGYWEIEKVILPSGEKKEYKINESIDYFEIKDFNGFRKKVFPQLNGKYLINDVSENIKIEQKSGIYFLSYSTDYANWKEELIVLQDSVLVLKNTQKIEYHYKKFQPFSLK